MAERTENYYTNVCKKLNLDLPVFELKDLTQEDKELMNFIDMDLLPYVQGLAEKYGFNKKDFTVTYASSPKSFTFWVTDTLDNKPMIITDIYTDGTLNGTVNKYDATANADKVNKFINVYLDDIKEFIRHDLND